MADDDDVLFALAVESVEIAAGDEGNAESGEKSGRNGAELGARIFFAGSAHVAVGGELEAGTEACRRRARERRCRKRLVHAGKLVNAANGFFVEVGDLSEEFFRRT